MDKVAIAERELHRIDAEIAAVMEQMKAAERQVAALRGRYDQLRHFVKLAETLFSDDERHAAGLGQLAQHYAASEKQFGLAAALRATSQDQVARQRAAEEHRAKAEATYERIKKATLHAATLSDALRASPPGSEAAGRGDASRSTRERIASAVEEILRIEGTKSTRELLPLLEIRGIEVGTSSPTGYLSVLLSRDDRFKSDRSTGWSLVDGQQEKEEEDPAGASTPAGSSE